MTTRICSVDGCENPARSRGLCKPHHKRWLRGRPIDTPIKQRAKAIKAASLEELARKLLAEAVETSNGCLELPHRCTDPETGYPRTTFKGQGWSIPRLMVSVIVEERALLTDEHSRHRCDNRTCINPEHLELGSPTDNVQDMDERGRRRNRPSLGTDHGCAKLTEADVRAIRELRKEGWILRELAARFGVSKGQISSICTRKTWKHL